MNRKNSLRSIDWWSFHSYATSPSTASLEERKLNYGKRVCTPGSATSNGYISRTKHRRRGVQRLSNVLRSSPSFKTIPSSIGSEFAFAASRNGQTNQPTNQPTNQQTNRLTEANFIGQRLKPGGFAAGQKPVTRNCWEINEVRTAYLGIKMRIPEHRAIEVGAEATAEGPSEIASGRIHYHRHLHSHSIPKYSLELLFLAFPAIRLVWTPLITQQEREREKGTERGLGVVVGQRKVVDKLDVVEGKVADPIRPIRPATRNSTPTRSVHSNLLHPHSLASLKPPPLSPRLQLSSLATCDCASRLCVGTAWGVCECGAVTHQYKWGNRCVWGSPSLLTLPERKPFLSRSPR